MMEHTNEMMNRMGEDEIDLRELARSIGRHTKKLIVFSVVVTGLSVVWSLSKPNIYQSQAVLVPQEQSKSAGLGGLGALAGMAGVDLESGGMLPDQAYQLYLNDYNWMRQFLIDTKLVERINAPDADQHYRFAFGIDTFYRWNKDADDHAPRELTPDAVEQRLFNTYQIVKGRLTIGADKKTTAITISYIDPDPVLAKEIVELFLKHASVSLRNNELSDMERKIAYYDHELSRTSDLALKTQLSQLMSGLIQKKILAQSSEYYNVKLITPPSVAYERDKTGPKRGLTVVVSFITSLIIGIFGVFLLEFLRKSEEEATV